MRKLEFWNKFRVRCARRAQQQHARRVGGAPDDGRTDLEEVEGRTGVEAALLVHGAEDSGLRALLRGEAGGEVELEALGNLVLELDGVAEDVGGGPGLGDGESVGLVGPLALDVAVDDVGLGVLGAGDLEGDVGSGVGLDLKGGAVEGVLLLEEVVGRLAKVLCACRTSETTTRRDKLTVNSPSRKGEQAEEETLLDLGIKRVDEALATSDTSSK